MENHWAVEQLQTIRTLMERSAVYRRALAPIMTFVGVVGILAAVGGGWLSIATLRGFVGFWMGVGALASVGALLLVRRQALKEEERFWSLPTRRVAQALFPPYFAGLAVSSILLIEPAPSLLNTGMLPAFWMLLYACGLHSAGFFMTRGIRLFSWLFLLVGCALVGAAGFLAALPGLHYGHAIMGLTFGGLHLAYGIYLSFTEKGRKAS